MTTTASFIKTLLLSLSTIALVTGMGCKKGEPGPPGTSNVIFSPWLTSSASKDTTIDGSLVKRALIDAPKITRAILDSGDVKVYFTYGSGTFVLPYTSNAGGKPNTINYILSLQKIIVTRFTHDNSASVNLGVGNQYRYIITPGGTSARGASPVDWNDYAAVAAYYGIPD